MPRTLAEQETIFRWDFEEQVLWANTTNVPTVRRWAKNGIKAQVIGSDLGEPCSWAVRVPFRHRRDWIKVMRLAVPKFQSAVPTGGPVSDPEEVGQDTE